MHRSAVLIILQPTQQYCYCSTERQKRWSLFCIYIYGYKYILMFRLLDLEGRREHALDLSLSVTTVLFHRFNSNLDHWLCSLTSHIYSLSLLAVSLTAVSQHTFPHTGPRSHPHTHPGVCFWCPCWPALCWSQLAHQYLGSVQPIRKLLLGPWEWSRCNGREARILMDGLGILWMLE